MSELRDWLGKHKLEQYADAFEANDIDLDILPDLSDSDLEQLGLSLGNRRRLLKALADRGGETAPSAPAADVADTGKGERRQVTVLFADMVGSTALSGKVDPELLAGLMRRYQDAAAGAIVRYGGFVAKFMGDGVLAYFGFPRAFEDAAERAVRAATDIVREVSGIELADKTRMQARIGIATGLVVVGEIIGTGTAQERTIVGETPNLAARLQALADPDAILVSETTRNLLGGRFELESAGQHDLKGFARRIPVWRVAGEAAVESRFAALHGGASLPYIGRAHEMGLLVERWRRASLGEGQIVTLVGEAGIGKSRSIEALQEAMAGEPHSRVNLQCSPYHSDSALYPVTQFVKRAAGFAATDTPQARIEKLGALFPQQTASIPLLAEFLSIATPLQPETRTPAQRRAALLSLFVDAWIGAGERAPVLVVVEDAHWIDVTTLDLMTRLTDSIGHARVLALVTARPDFEPPWRARPQATHLILGRLGRQECEKLVSGVAAAHGISAQTIAAIVARTDGIPLFAEELTKSVMESAGEGGAVPATLKDSLMARLDRLDAAREVAQIAAVIGRQFTFRLLEAVAKRAADELAVQLGRLAAAGIVFPEERAQELSFSFKHALMRDAAYESLLLSRRREWHERIALALERQFADIAANEPDLLAYHFGEAGLSDRACDYRLRAGEQAVGRSAYPEAVAHFSSGLKLADAMPAPHGPRRRLEFLLQLGSATVVVNGLHSDEAEDAYLKAGAIAGELGDGPSSFQAKWGLWINANMRRKTAQARHRAQELVDLARGSGEEDLLLEASHCQWSTAFFCGEVEETLAGSRRGIELYDMARHRHLGHSFGAHDPGACAYAQCGNALQMAGDPQQASQFFALAVDLAERLDHPNTLAHALHNTAIGHQLGGDRDAAYAAANRAADVSKKFGFAPWRGSSLVLAGWAVAVGAGVAEGAAMIDAEIGKATAVGALPRYYLGVAAEVLLAAGRPADALAHLDRAIDGTEEPGVGLYLPEIYRLRGACLLALSRDNKDLARSHFVTARDIAARQGAVIFERRAAASLADLAG